MFSLSQTAGRLASALPFGSRLLTRAADGDGREVAILMLHRVLPNPSACYDPEMVTSLAAFEALLPWLAEHYEVIALEDVSAQKKAPGGRQKPRCAITFDDGWLDTFVHAFPLLQHRQLPATVFLPLHFIGTDRRFWQERLYYHLRKMRARPGAAATLGAIGRQFVWCPELHEHDLEFSRIRSLLLRRSSAEAAAFVEQLGAVAGLSLDLVGRAFMNWDEVRAMQRAGIAFGSHTLEHTLLSQSAPGVAEAELRYSRQALSQQLGAEVRAFSYPWGGLSPFSREQVAAAGYTCAVTVTPGMASAHSDPLQLPRIAISSAQLGWPAVARPARFSPATLQIHKFRARIRPSRPLPNLLTASGGGRPRLRLGFIIDNPYTWADEYEARLGGSELQLLRLMEALDPEYFAIELYFLNRPTQGLPTQCRWPCFAAAKHGAGRLATIAGLRRLLRQRRPALVQTMFQDGMFLGVPAAWLADVPAILCARRNAGYWKRWFHPSALRVLNRLATCWQANGIAVADMLRRQEGVPAAAIEITPNWLDLKRFRPANAAQRRAARTRLGLPENGFLAVSVGNYRPVKRLDTFVAAALRLCRLLPQSHFLLLGEGPEGEALAAKVAAEKLSQRVQLLGARENVEDYLRAADVGVLTSASEGCSNAVLEYMAAGLPTVLSDIPANRALVNQGLFPVGNTDALSALLLELAANPGLCAQRGRANRLRAEQYGGDAFTERAQAHYTRAAGAGMRRTRASRGIGLTARLAAMPPADSDMADSPSPAARPF